MALESGRMLEAEVKLRFATAEKRGFLSILFEYVFDCFVRRRQAWRIKPAADSSK